MTDDTYMGETVNIHVHGETFVAEIGDGALNASERCEAVRYLIASGEPIFGVWRNHHGNVGDEHALLISPNHPYTVDAPTMEVEG